MDKSLAGLIAAASVLASPAVTPADAATGATAMQATSYSDLLKPIPNALALLRESDSAASLDGTAESRAAVQDVQYWYYNRRRYHHHHHHHRYWYHHHHHYHHHHNT